MAPRQIIPGRRHLITRRCSERRFLLRPGKTTNQIFEFCLADAARRTGVKVIGYSVMSNHYHALVEDVEGRLPEFLEHLHKMVARAMNAHWRRKEHFWSSEPPCVTHLVTPGDVFEKLLYVLANPVTARLVDRVHNWPGAHSLAAMLSGDPVCTERPRGFFRQNGPTPPGTSLELVRPPGFEHLSQKAWADHLKDRLSTIENQVRATRLAERKSIAGRKAVLTASHLDLPAEEETGHRLRPTIACKNRELRAAAIAALQAFRRAYAYARQRFVQGVTDVLFPFGTYHMRVLGLRCASAP